MHAHTEMYAYAKAKPVGAASARSILSKQLEILVHQAGTQISAGQILGMGLAPWRRAAYASWMMVWGHGSPAGWI